MFPQKLGPYGNRRPFPEPYLAYPSGSPVKDPSFQVPLTVFPRREMPHSQSPPSFIFQSLRYKSSLTGSPAGHLWREMPVSRAFLYSSSRVPGKGAPPSSGSPHRAPSKRDAVLLEPLSSTLRVVHCTIIVYMSNTPIMGARL